MTDDRLTPHATYGEAAWHLVTSGIRNMGRSYPPIPFERLGLTSTTQWVWGRSCEEVGPND